MLDSPRATARSSGVSPLWIDGTEKRGERRVYMTSRTIMAEELNVEVRNVAGKRHAKRLRRGGSIRPCSIHGEQTFSLAVSREQFSTALRHGSRLWKLKGA